MRQDDEAELGNLDPSRESDTTESGELERPRSRKRKIDCGGNPEIADRRDARGCGASHLDASSEE